MGVLLDRDAVVHLIDAQDLRFTIVAAELVVLAHDQRFDRFGRTDFCAQSAEAAARQVEVEVIEHLDLRAWFAMPAERNQIVGAGLGALIADDAGLRAGARFGLQPEDAAETRRGLTPLRRILKGKGRLRCVLQRNPQTFEQVDEKDRFEELDDGLHYARSPISVGSVSPDMMTRSLRRTVPSLRILSWRRINPYSSASGRGGQPET